MMKENYSTRFLCYLKEALAKAFGIDKLPPPSFPTLLKKIYLIKLTGSIVFIFTFFITSASFTIAQETTGSVEGVVNDETGAVVPGIGITVKSTGKSIAFRRNVTTKEDGSFAIQQVPPGTYEIITAEEKGFGAASVSNVIVTLGKTSLVKIMVAPSGTVTNVDVSSTGSFQIDTTDQKIQTNITRKEIASIPRGANFASLLRISPAVRDEPLAGGFQVDGASGSENTFIIDGQEVTNFRTGVLNANNNLPVQFIQEIQVKSSGFEAEFGGAIGGVKNIVTRGGNNEYHGELELFFSPSKFRGENRKFLLQFQRNGERMVELFQTPKDPSIDFLPSASFSGRIIRDRLWFFGGYAPQIFERKRTIPYFSSRDPQTRRIVQRETYTSRRQSEYAFGRLDAEIKGGIRVNASYTWNPIAVRGSLPGAASGLSGVRSIPQTTFPDGTTRVGPAFNNFRGGRQSANNTNVQGTWNATDDIIVNARYGYSFLNEKIGNYGIPPVGAPFFRCSINSSNIPSEAGCAAGEGLGVYTNELLFDVSTRHTFDIDSSFFINALGGRHAFKVGYQLNRLANNISSQFSPVIFIRYGETLSNLSRRPLTNNPNAVGAGLLQRFGRQGNVSSKNQAVYIQDKFQPTNRLTLSLGFRIESEDVPSFTPGLPGIEFGWGDKFTPRIGGAYDLTGDGTHKIFANWGWFHDRFKYELPRGLFGGAFWRNDYFEVFPGDGRAFDFTIQRILGTNPDRPGGNCPSPGGIANSTGITRCQRDFRSPSNTPGDILQSGGIDPNLKPFRQTEFTAGYEHQFSLEDFSLLSGDYILSSRYTHKQVDRAVEDLGFLNSFGSEVYLIGNPGLGLARQTFLDSNLIPVKAQRDYDAVELRLEKRLSNNYYFNANYTYSRLFGNYGGLASSDEDGRTSPNVDRNFDSPISGFTADGRPDNGRLATDRPHVFKMFGGYNVNWSENNTTEFSAFQNISSGTPITTIVNVLGIGTIPLTRRGDLGRTAVFSQTDLGVRHRYKFGMDGKFIITAEIDILNLFDEANELGKFRSIAPALSSNEKDLGFTSGTASQNLVNFIRAFQKRSFSQQIIARINQKGDKDVRYGLSSSFQGPRSVRFGFRFTF